MSEEEEPPVCSWCEQPVEGDYIGWWEPAGDKPERGVYCSAECLLAAL